MLNVDITCYKLLDFNSQEPKQKVTNAHQRTHVCQQVFEVGLRVAYKFPGRITNVP